jgi:hypothetical protein
MATGVGATRVSRLRRKYCAEPVASAGMLTTRSGQSPIVPELYRIIGPSAHWRHLPLGTRIAIIVASIAGLVLLIAGITWFCVRSTRKGLREHAKAEAEWEAQRKEAEEWRQRYREDHRLGSMNSTTKSMQLDNA